MENGHSDLTKLFKILEAISNENMAKLVGMSENSLIRITKAKLDNSTNSSVVITIVLVKEC